MSTITNEIGPAAAYVLGYADQRLGPAAAYILEDPVQARHQRLARDVVMLREILAPALRGMRTGSADERAHSVMAVAADIEQELTADSEFGLVRSLHAPNKAPVAGTRSLPLS